MKKAQSKVKVAIIGFGHLGKWHAEKAFKLANLVAIVEINEEQKKEAKDLYPDVMVTDNIDSVIKKIDAVFIVTPTSTHFELLTKFMKHNKHIFCEKPLCSNDHQALKLKELNKVYKSVLQVGHSERFHESWNIIETYKKFLGGKCFIRMNRFAPFKGRATDVDVVQDLMIHDLDLLVHIFKEKPISVKSTGFKIRTSNWDFVSSQFKFKSQKQAFLVSSRNHVKEVRDLEVFSDEGCLYVDLFNNEILVSGQQVKSENAETHVEKLNYNKRDHLLIEQKHFYDSIDFKKKAIVGLGDGLTAVHLISKVLESIESQQETEIDYL